MTQPLSISIVTPSFNQGRFLEEAIRSVLAQEYPQFEHIVIDGGSTDQTLEILRNYPHLQWVSEKDRGQTHAINKGLEQARGDIRAYLCADDAYAPGAFRFVSDYFAEHPEVEFLYGDCWFIDGAGKVLRRKKAVPFSRQRLLRHNLIWQPTVFFRASVWRKVGPFNEALQFAMDYEYWLRAAEHCRLAAVNRHLANYRFHPDSKSMERQREQLHEAYRVSRRFGGGGLVSWWLHYVYWPHTDGLKRWLFSLFEGLRFSSKQPTSRS